MYLLAQACDAKEITERYYPFLEPKADSIKNMRALRNFFCKYVIEDVLLW